LIAQLGAAEVAAWLKDDAREKPLLIDVREPWEYAICHIEGAQLIPLQSIPNNLAQLPKDRDLVLICHRGNRSNVAAQWLARNGYERLHNLRGGVAAWASEVDPTMARY